MRFLKSIVLLLAVLLAGFSVFFFWGSAETLPASEWAATTTYPALAATVSPTDTISVMTYNIGYLSGMTNNRPVDRDARLFDDNMEAAVRLIRQIDPDVVGFQEIDFGAARSFYAHQLDTLARRGGFHASATAVNWDKRYVPFPYGLPSVHFGQMLSGQAMLSRYPIRAHTRYPLQRMPSPFYYDAFFLERLAQVVEVDLGPGLIVINVHLEAFDAATRTRQAEEVLTLYRQYKDDHPVLLIGDFNSVMPDSRKNLSADERSWLEGDRATEVLLQEESLREAFTVLGITDDAGTYPSDTPRRKIDHIFYNASHITPVAAFTVDGSDQPSDHRAVVMQFTLNVD